MQEFHDKHPGIQVKLWLSHDRQSLPETMRLVLFRVLQEAVANVARHAQATEIQIRFTFDAEEARLEVSDNGKGFVVPADWMSVVREGHYGLAGMSERVTAAGGLVSVESTPGSSTTIRVTIPCEKA
jgi:signal transduction histidine kinase